MKQDLLRLMAYSKRGVVVILLALSGLNSAPAEAQAPPLLTLFATFTHPSSSGFVLDAPQAYFVSANGQTRLPIDGWAMWPQPSKADPWPIVDLKQLPSMLRLRWFSAADDQFWSIHLPLPTHKLRHYVGQSLRGDAGLTSVFDRLIVTVKNEGWVSVWLGNQTYEIQLTDEVQARKVELAWSEFIQSWPVAQRLDDREAWRTAIREQQRPYYNLRFQRTYDGDEPAVDSAYEVYTETDSGRRHYCGKTDQHGQTREFVTAIEAKAFHMTHDEAGCALVQRLDQDLPKRPALPWPFG